MRASKPTLLTDAAWLATALALPLLFWALLLVASFLPYLNQGGN
jgi:hypothetical protein